MAREVMQASPTESQLRSQLRQRVAKHPSSSFFAFFAGRGYAGSAYLELGDRRFEVVEILSPLHFVEQALRADEGEALVCLCPHREWVSEDVEERLAGGGVRDLDPWEAVRGLFRVQHLEPGLTRNRELARVLLESAPLDGYAVPPGPQLSEDFLWTTVLREQLGLPAASFDPVELLAWAVDSEASSARVQLAAPALIQAAAEWLSRRGGPLPAVLLNLLRSNEPIDLAAFGIVCEVLYREGVGPDALKATGAFEMLLDHPSFNAAAGHRWAESLAHLLANRAELPAWWDATRQRAMDQLSKFRAVSEAVHSLLLPEGLEARLNAAATHLERREAIPAGLRAQLEKHALFRPSTRVRLQAAERVLRYLAAPTLATPDGLAAAVDEFHSHHAWADRAAQSLLTGEPHAGLNAAFSGLVDAVETRREPFSQHFARALVAWNAGRDEAVLPVEKVLSDVVAPLAKRRILVLVLDGCSWPVLLALLEDWSVQSWQHYIPTDASRQRLISGLPSVTEVSRCSLLSGQACVGDAEAEKLAFAASSALSAVSRKEAPPVVFHKADLRKEATFARIAGDSAKVVGLVINTIDDTLSSEQHLNLDWRAELLGPLERVMLSAAQSQRLVLVVSDHGHLLERGTVERPSKDAGNRWQHGSAAEEGAVVVEGGRLQLASAARLLWTSRVRYGPKKRGYHGGASPQEVVCSLALLAPSGQKIDGWQEGRLQPPAWWWEPSTPMVWGEANLFGARAKLAQLLRVSSAFDLKCRSEGQPPGGWDVLLEAVAAYREGVSITRLSQELGISEPQLLERLKSCQRWFRLDGVDVLYLEKDAARVLGEVNSLYRLPS